MSLLCSLPIRLWSWNIKDAFSLYTCAPGLGTRDSSMKNNLFLIWEDWCTTGTSSPILVPSYGRAKKNRESSLVVSQILRSGIDKGNRKQANISSKNISLILQCFIKKFRNRHSCIFASNALSMCTHTPIH